MSNANQYLTLALGAETFGIDIRHVREILDLDAIAALPLAPRHLLGMIDVRGEGVPVVSLRRKLGLEDAEFTPATRIVILDVTIRDRSAAVGIVTDRVIEVAALDGEALEPAPEVGGRWQARCLEGIGRRGPSFVMVLDVDRLMAADAGGLANDEAPVGAAA